MKCQNLATTPVAINSLYQTSQGEVKGLLNLPSLMDTLTIQTRSGWSIIIRIAPHLLLTSLQAQSTTGVYRASPMQKVESGLLCCLAVICQKPTQDFALRLELQTPMMPSTPSLINIWSSSNSSGATQRMSMVVHSPSGGWRYKPFLGVLMIPPDRLPTKH